VVARVNCSERTLSDHQCHFFEENSFLQLLGYSSPISFSKLNFEILQWNSFPFQGFQNHFQNPLSVPILEFLLHYKLFQRLDASHHATKSRGYIGIDKGVIP
jgi:hypothetical protein